MQSKRGPVEQVFEQSLTVDDKLTEVKFKNAAHELELSLEVPKDLEFRILEDYDKGLTKEQLVEKYSNEVAVKVLVKNGLEFQEETKNKVSTEEVAKKVKEWSESGVRKAAIKDRLQSDLFQMSEPEIDRLLESLGIKNEQTGEFKTGDKVKITKGLDAGFEGVIKQFFSDGEAQIRSANGEIRSVVLDKLVKNRLETAEKNAYPKKEIDFKGFKIGDHVKVISGAAIGSQGKIIGFSERYGTIQIEDEDKDDPLFGGKSMVSVTPDKVRRV